MNRYNTIQCIHTYMPTYIYTYIHTYVHTYVRTYVRMYVCMYICMYIYACMHCIVLYRFIYIALLAVHTNQKRFQCERPREKRAVLRERKEALGSPVNKEACMCVCSLCLYVGLCMTVKRMHACVRVYECMYENT